MGLYGTDFTALREPLSPEDATLESATARRAYHGPWSQRWDFARAVLGRETIVPGPPLSITYEQPAHYPGRPDLLAVRVAMQGDGASFEDPAHADEIAYDHCVAEVTFETRAWEANEDELFTLDLDAASEFIAVEGGTVFESGHVVPGVTPILMQQVDFSLDFRRLVGIPWHWFDLVGHTNDATWRGRPRGTLLFLPSSARATRTVSGNTLYQGRAAISYRRIPWNYAWNPYVGEFEEVTAAATGLPIYPEADFTQLAPAT